MVEVFAERVVRHRLFEVLIRRRNDPDVHLDRLVRADAGDLVVLENAQKLHLGRQRHIADFVQEDRPPLGVFEFTDPVRRGVGKRPFDVAEQFAFENVLAERGAVERDERTVLPRRVLMDRLGEQLLAGPRLAQDQNRRVGRRDPFQPVDGAEHRRGIADHPVEPELFVEPLPHLAVQTAQTGTLPRLPNDFAQMVQALGGFGQVVVRPQLHRLDRDLDPRVGGHQNHFRLGRDLFDPAEDLKSPVVLFLFPIEHQVGHDDVEYLLVDGFFRLFPGMNDGADGVDLLERLGHRVGKIRFVVDDQHRQGEFVLVNQFVFVHGVLYTQIRRKRGPARRELPPRRRLYHRRSGKNDKVRPARRGVVRARLFPSFGSRDM